MQKNLSGSASILARILLAIAALAAASGAAFAAWQAHGDGIFVAMVESGLSWCF